MSRHIIIKNALARYADSPYPCCPGCGEPVDVESVENGGTFKRFYIPGLSAITGYFICSNCNDPDSPIDSIDEVTARNDTGRFVITIHDTALLNI